jgi:hypothetical protein
MSLRDKLLSLLSQSDEEVSNDPTPSPSVPAPVMVVVREKLLGSLTEKQEATEPAVVKPLVVEKAGTMAPGACPRCGSTLFSYPGGSGKRCQACGLQTGMPRSNGVKRSELESFSGGRMKMNTAPFFQALARLRGR